ncbi:MAG: FAD-dependent monooxygenase [Sciscionella sp.]|nr:FAD-dependent monooxygenase [Sciscionella sp.]
MRPSRAVLISGAGIAGNTLAYWLARNGFAPTVIERSGRMRGSGNPVDVAGRAFDVVERMGVLDELRTADTGATDLVFVDAQGKRVGGLAFRRDGARHLELPRGTLAGVLRRAAEPNAEYLFNDSITALHQDEHGVDVTFERTNPRRKSESPARLILYSVLFAIWKATQRNRND